MRLRVHAASGVANRDSGSITLHLGSDRQTSSTRHRVDGIEQQIDEYVVDMRLHRADLHSLFQVHFHLYPLPSGLHLILPAGARD